jgi:hypothetical protein
MDSRSLYHHCNACVCGNVYPTHLGLALPQVKVVLVVLQPRLVLFHHLSYLGCTSFLGQSRQGYQL